LPGLEGGGSPKGEKGKKTGETSGEERRGYRKHQISQILGKGSTKGGRQDKKQETRKKGGPRK